MGEAVSRKVQVNDWKVTVTLAAKMPAEGVAHGTRYLAILNRPLNDVTKVADLVLRSVVRQQLSLPVVGATKYITVGVWHVEGYQQVLLGVKSARFHEEDKVYEYAENVREIDPEGFPGELRLMGSTEWRQA